MMECNVSNYPGSKMKLQDSLSVFQCQIQSVARSLKIHDPHVDSGNLLREENGVITASGIEKDPHTIFRIHTSSAENGLIFQIQSAVDNDYLAIDQETGNLIITKNSEDKSTLFCPSKYDHHCPSHVVLESYVNKGIYVSAEESGFVHTIHIYDKSQLICNISTWFRIELHDGDEKSICKL